MLMYGKYIIYYIVPIIAKYNPGFMMNIAIIKYYRGIIASFSKAYLYYYILYVLSATHRPIYCL